MISNIPLIQSEQSFDVEYHCVDISERPGRCLSATVL